MVKVEAGCSAGPARQIDGRMRARIRLAHAQGVAWLDAGAGAAGAPDFTPTFATAHARAMCRCKEIAHVLHGRALSPANLRRR